MEEIKFSKSRYSLMKECLGKYFFQYIEKKKVPDTLWPGTIYGTALHLYIENFLKEIKNKNDIKRLPKFSETFFLEKKRALQEDPLLQYKIPRGFMEVLFVEDANKWSKKVMEFLLLFLPSGEKVLEEEMNETIEIGEDKIHLTGVVDLQILGEKNYIFDFKNTKKPQGYYFVQWDRDPQSLSYLYMLRKGVPSFSYLVFDIENGMILSQGRPQYNSNDKEALFLLFEDFLSLHRASSREDLWTQNPDTCRWCKFKEICKVKK